MPMRAVDDAHSLDGVIVSDDPIGERLEAALRWCQRRAARRAGCHPTAPVSTHYIDSPTPRAQKILGIDVEKV